MSVSSRIRRIAVIGAGTMGHGIAELAAMHGYHVVMVDISDEILSRALQRIRWSLMKLSDKSVLKESIDEIMARIKTTTSIEDACRDVDLAIEAVPEDPGIKRDVFKRMDSSAPEHVVLATNTSSIPISELAEATARREKVVGIHFFNPPIIMKLVEIVKSRYTSDETVEIARSLVLSLGKTPVLVSKDVPGFIVNRIVSRHLNEACHMVYENMHSIEEIDAAVRFRLGFPMGPLELLDYSGLDVFYHIMKTMRDHGIPMHICPLLEEYVKDNRLGVKTGKGFYSYPEPGTYVKPVLSRNLGVRVDLLRLITPSINDAVKLLEEGVAGIKDIETATKLGLSWPHGPFEYADMIGIDNVVSRLTSLGKKSGWEDYKVSKLLSEKKSSGELGIKTGVGFHKYEVSIEEYPGVTMRRENNGIAWVILNNPRKLNVLDVETLKSITSVFRKLDKDDRVKIVLLTGSGRAFSAGADVSVFKDMKSTEAYEFSKLFHEPIEVAEKISKPVIAVINGYALGGGLELALACDLRVAAIDAQLGSPEINLGIIPGGGATQRLPRIIGLTRSKEIVLTGDYIDAITAFEWGLINRLATREGLEFEARLLADKLSGKSMDALAYAKRSLNSSMDSTLSNGILVERGLFSTIFSSEDASKSINAFLKSRKR